MNSLSLLIYLAAVLPNISMLASFAFNLFCVTSFLTAVIYGLNHDEFSNFKRGQETSTYLVRKNWFVFGPIVAVLVVISTLIPDKETIYLIAASEMGEVVVNTPEAQEMLSDIQTIIKQQLNQMKEVQ